METALRTFVAIDLPQEAKDALASLIARIKAKGLDGVRWVNPETIHLTLKFMADTRAADVERILEASKQAVQGIRPFELRLAQLGGFPGHHNPRVIWIGVEGDLWALQQVQNNLEALVSPLGYPGDHRGFNPHITLGRVKQDMSAKARLLAGEALTAEPRITHQRWTVQELVYIHSTLTPRGPIYRTLGAIPLTGLSMKTQEVS